MVVDPRAVSAFVVTTEEAELEVHGALLANEIGRFVHEWSLHLVFTYCAYCHRYYSTILHCTCKYHVSSGARSGSGIGNQTIAR